MWFILVCDNGKVSERPPEPTRHIAASTSQAIGNIPQSKKFFIDNHSYKQNIYLNSYCL